METIRFASAVGDLCALYFKLDGDLAQVDFHNHRIDTSKNGLQNIGTRLVVAGSIKKAEAIRGGYIIALVTNNLTTKKVLELDLVQSQ